MLKPARALVRPRVISSQSSESIPLEDALRLVFAASSKRVVALVGPVGSGKKTALAHLMATWQAPGPVDICYRSRPSVGKLATKAPFVVYATREGNRDDADAVLTLAPWSRDDVIEYLLAAHPNRVASVLGRFGVPSTEIALARLGGNPELCRAALDVLARRESIADPRAALAAFVNEQAPAGMARKIIQFYATAELCGQTCLAAAFERGARLFLRKSPLRRLARHRVIRLHIVAEMLKEMLERRERCVLLGVRLPRDLLAETGAAVAQSPMALGELERMLRDRSRWGLKAICSILHLAGGPSRPPTHGAETLDLSGAVLAGVGWPGIDLSSANLLHADFSRADLRSANLDTANARKAKFVQARLTGAILSNLDGNYINLGGAHLERARGSSGVFWNGDLQGSRWDGADLSAASFSFADLRGASFRNANLRRASFRSSVLGETDFSGACLAEADLERTNFRRGKWDGANFTDANLKNADLESIEADRLDFSSADLTNALLTGSVLRRAVFRGACLARAGMGDIAWEGADLRDADFSQATFHLGSSRGGLVDSPIACEGSRTGFYTDESLEQTFKAPEEIRKANLRGADLRGARVSETDWYLVDLRDARYTPDQALHFQRSGAILQKRIGSM